MPTKTEVATFAGGCFWCMEPPYDGLDGVIATIPGYTGGHKENPTYQEVCDGRTGHTEAIQVEYDPTKIRYEELLKVFWRNIDPTAKNQQFCDVGSQYRTAIYYHNETQKMLAEASKKEIEQRYLQGAPIATEITTASTFYPAEEYHQDFYRKNPLRYKLYRSNSGRDERLDELWGPAEKQVFNR